MTTTQGDGIFSISRHIAGRSAAEVAGGAVTARIVAVQAYPTIVPRSGKMQRISLDMNPAVRGWRLKVSMALATVGELYRRSSSRRSGWSGSNMRASGVRGVACRREILAGRERPLPAIAATAP